MHALNRVIHELVSILAHWRLDHDVYALPFELWLKNAASRWFPPLKSKVDVHQLHPEAVTC